MERNRRIISAFKILFDRTNSPVTQLVLALGSEVAGGGGGGGVWCGMAFLEMQIIYMSPTVRLYSDIELGNALSTPIDHIM